MSLKSIRLFHLVYFSRRHIHDDVIVRKKDEPESDRRVGTTTPRIVIPGGIIC